MAGVSDVMSVPCGTVTSICVPMILLVPLGTAKESILFSALFAAIRIESSLLALPVLLVAVTVKVAVPATAGVPLMTPLAPSSAKPAGRLPEVMLQLTGVSLVAVSWSK